MALSDPQTVTVGTSQTLARTLTGAQDATYASADGAFFLKVSHQITKTRKRSLISINRKKITEDALTDIKSEIVATLNITFDRPLAGFTEAELLELITGISAWGSASTNANYKKVLGLES